MTRRFVLTPLSSGLTPSSETNRLVLLKEEDLMAKNSDNLLGMGGQRNTVSRTTMRGGKSEGKGGPGDDARERKQELLRRFREKNSAQEGKDVEERS